LASAAPATSLEAYLIGAETGGGANDSTIAAGEIGSLYCLIFMGKF